MKTEQNILIAFVLNLFFAVFEFVGGIYTGSVAIVSDAVHDLGDALSIGISYYFEKKSKMPPDDKCTYGYGRYSILGGLITTLVLLGGSCMMLFNAVRRMVSPIEINYTGMIIFAIIGVFVNLSAAYLTHKGDSINQKAVNLHMLEDVLGWIVVLVGAFVMRFTSFALIDPIMSIGISLFICVNTVKYMKDIFGVLLEKVPGDLEVSKIKEHIERIDGVCDVHHIHLWSLDGQNNIATMHIVTENEPHVVKDLVRDVLQKHGIDHVTIEIESAGESGDGICCSIKHNTGAECRSQCHTHHFH